MCFSSELLLQALYATAPAFLLGLGVLIGVGGFVWDVTH